MDNIKSVTFFETQCRNQTSVIADDLSDQFHHQALIKVQQIIMTVTNHFS